MAEMFQLRVVTPHRAIVDQAVEEVTAPGTLGEFGVLPNHAALLTSLEIGGLSYKDTAGTHRIAVRGGFAEVADNVMTVLAEAVAEAADIDAVQSKADLREAEERLKKLSPLDEDFSATDNARRWAEVLLDAAQAK